MSVREEDIKKQQELALFLAQGMMLKENIDRLVELAVLEPAEGLDRQKLEHATENVISFVLNVGKVVALSKGGLGKLSTEEQAELQEKLKDWNEDAILVFTKECMRCFNHAVDVQEEVGSLLGKLEQFCKENSQEIEQFVYQIEQSQASLQSKPESAQPAIPSLAETAKVKTLKEVVDRLVDLTVQYPVEGLERQRLEHATENVISCALQVGEFAAASRAGLGKMSADERAELQGKLRDWNGEVMLERIKECMRCFKDDVEIQEEVSGLLGTLEQFHKESFQQIEHAVQEAKAAM